MNKQFFKFLVVGGVNTLFGYGLFVLFLFSGLHYAIAVLAATILGVMFNFFTIGGIVFSNTEYQLIFRFIGVYTVVYLFNVSGLWIFECLGINLYLAGAILILPLALISFTLNKRYVFVAEKGNYEAY